MKLLPDCNRQDMQPKENKSEADDGGILPPNCYVSQNLKCSKNIGNYECVLLYLAQSVIFLWDILRFMTSSFQQHFFPWFHLYCAQLRGRLSEMKEADVTKFPRTENGSAACGSSCQDLITEKSGTFFFSFEDEFLGG